MAPSPFLAPTILLSPAVAELGPVDFPVSTACAPAPTKGNANKPAARSNEREIEIIAVSSHFQIWLPAHAAPTTKRASL
jgi:hypothetical protein